MLNSIQGINLKTNSFYSVYQCRKSQSCRFYVQFRWNLAICLEVRDQIRAQILFPIPWTPQLVQPLLCIFSQQSSTRISNPLHRVGEWENAERKSGTFSEIYILFLDWWINSHRGNTKGRFWVVSVTLIRKSNPKLNQKYTSESKWIMEWTFKDHLLQSLCCESGNPSLHQTLSNLEWGLPRDEASSLKMGPLKFPKYLRKGKKISEFMCLFQHNICGMKRPIKSR